MAVLQRTVVIVVFVIIATQPTLCSIKFIQTTKIADQKNIVLLVKSDICKTHFIESIGPYLSSAKSKQ